MKQTALQELLQWVRATLPMDLDTPRMIEEKIESLLPMEKEQMDKVAGDWWNEGASYMHDGKRKYESFEQYYNETYGGQGSNTNTGAVGYKALEHKEPVVVGTLRGPNGNTSIFKGDAATGTEEINPLKKDNR